MSAEAAVLAAGEDLRASLASVVAAVLDTTPVSLAPEYAVSGDELALTRREVSVSVWEDSG